MARPSENYKSLPSAINGKAYTTQDKCYQCEKKIRFFQSKTTRGTTGEIAHTKCIRTSIRKKLSN